MRPIFKRQDILEVHLHFCDPVVVPDPPPSVPECRDPLDRPFLELALAGRADALVTGDAGLQALADSFAVPILTPAGLKRQIQDDERTGRYFPPSAR